MHVEVDIAKEKAKSMPKGSILALQEELTRRLGKKYGEVIVEIKTRVPTRYTSVARLKLSGKRLTPFWWGWQSLTQGKRETARFAIYMSHAEGPLKIDKFRLTKLKLELDAKIPTSLFLNDYLKNKILLFLKTFFCVFYLGIAGFITWCKSRNNGLKHIHVNYDRLPNSFSKL